MKINSEKVAALWELFYLHHSMASRAWNNKISDFNIFPLLCSSHSRTLLTLSRPWKVVNVNDFNFIFFLMTFSLLFFCSRSSLEQGKSKLKSMEKNGVEGSERKFLKFSFSPSLLVVEEPRVRLNGKKLGNIPTTKSPPECSFNERKKL